ncbi:replication factor C large subunit [Candidatus Woesearchaeota archaeon]|nr:replication factor C large subunit [Candidatus Woesearchaeota archaeon]
MSPWTKKYQPASTAKIKGQHVAIAKLVDFIKNYKKQKKRSLILHGPTGTGKTASVYAIATELDLELIEVNASDFRNADQIEQKLGNALGQQSLFFKQKLILVDEIDGLSGTKDRGGAKALNQLIKTSTYPIICTANDVYEKKLSTIRKSSELAQFHSLQYITIYNELKKIVTQENITVDDTTLKSLARRAGGDLRGAITDLQTLGKKITTEDLDYLGGRAQEENILQALARIFKTSDLKIALEAMQNVDMTPQEIMLWLEHNIPLEYKKPQDLVRAYDALSRADVFLGRIRRWQHWRFWVYAGALQTGGVAVAKDEKQQGFTKYSPTDRILKTWIANQKNNKKKIVAQKLAEHTHTSTRRAFKDTVPLLKNIFKHDKAQAAQIASSLELQNDEIEWLKA